MKKLIAPNTFANAYQMTLTLCQTMLICLTLLHSGANLSGQDQSVKPAKKSGQNSPQKEDKKNPKDDPMRKEIKRYFDLLNMENIFNHQMQAYFLQMTKLENLHLIENPYEAKWKGELSERVKNRVVKLAGWQTIEGTMTDFYRKIFKLEELRVINKRLSEPWFKIFMSKKLAIDNKLSQLSQEITLSAAPRILQTVKEAEEIAKIKAQEMQKD